MTADGKQHKGIVIYCSDPRPNLWKHIKEMLIPPSEIFIPIPLLGGPISLVHQTTLNIEYRCLRTQIDFALAVFSPQEFLVIGHDCGYYAKVGQNFPLSGKVSDIEKAVEFLWECYHLPVTGNFWHQEQKQFETITEVSPIA